MKKLMFTAVIVLFAIAANAQDLFVGGSLFFWNNSDAKHTSISLAPEIGYNLSEAWALGMQIGYSYEKVDEIKIKRHTNYNQVKKQYERSTDVTF